MRCIYYLLIAIFPILINAQQRTIKGTVTGSDTIPVIGANILIKGTSIGTHADFDGRYVLKAATGDVLVFRSIGYEQKEFAIKDTDTVINATLIVEEGALDEVVVMGYGTTKKKRRKKKHLKSNSVLSSSYIKAPVPMINHDQVMMVTTPQQNSESYKTINENTFKQPYLAPLSTFSIDVDKASYSNVRRLINAGEQVPKDAVKVEELMNYFNYEYDQPQGLHPFAIHTEVATTPWNIETQMVRIGLQGKTYVNEELPASNLVFLIDVSGSMNVPNKLGLLKSAYKLLVNQLREKDKVAIVVYAGAAGVVLPPTSGARKQKILNALDQLQAGGSTAGGKGIKLAYKMARKNFIKKGNNRVILATDGDFNVGASSNSAMQELIEKQRESGVFLSVLGFGYGNYKDSKLEALADKGNGNHSYIDTMQEAQKVFGKEFGGTLYTIAKDVKIQVEFNPNKVQAYRLIGYENRLLNDEDFVDDTKDAGELGSGHTVTALYEIVPVGVESSYCKAFGALKYTEAALGNNFGDELLTVKFRYKKPKESRSMELVRVVKAVPVGYVRGSDDFRFVSAVALFGLQLRKSEFTNQATLSDAIALAESGRGMDRDGYRAELIRLMKSYNSL